MTAPAPYLHFDGEARAALDFYAAAFGGEVEAYTFAQFSRTDGPGEAIAHGILRGPVELFAADIAPGEETTHVRGVLFSLLGYADADTLTRWFQALADGGTIVDDLQVRPWGAHDGQVTDRFDLTWLIGWED